MRIIVSRISIRIEDLYNHNCKMTIYKWFFNFTWLKTCIFYFHFDSNTKRNVSSRPEVSPILHVSYMWYTFVGAALTIVVGVAVSQINRWRGRAYVPPAPKLLAPMIRKLYREPPHPADEPFIRAYGCTKVSKFQFALASGSPLLLASPSS